MKDLNSIEEVIAALEMIISDSEASESTLGYFAVLYHKVTVKVKEGIAEGFFDNGPRMEKLDVRFARRYLDAYQAYKAGEPTTDSWKQAFDGASEYWYIVLQHLLMGINAHINLDLGIAAAEASQGENIGDLEGDFNKINDILSALLQEVQDGLSRIWPTLSFILKKTGRMDDLMVDFSMKLARDGAWKFANSMARTPQEEWAMAIAQRDQKVAQKVKLITKPGFFPQFLLGMIRLGERGAVSRKIKELKMK